MNAVRLVVRDLTVYGPDGALVRGLSFTARAGRVTALVGDSGAGKSVAARAAMGVIDAQPGLIAGSLGYPGATDVDLMAGLRGAKAGQRLRERTAPHRGRWITHAPQAASSALNPARTVGRQLLLARRRGGRGGPDEAAAIVRLLGAVGLPGTVAAARPAALSGGMAQRAALAIALAPGPAIIVADEPEAGLDPLLRRQLIDLLRTVVVDRGVALLLITHDDDLTAFADDVVVVTGRDP